MRKIIKKLKAAGKKDIVKMLLFAGVVGGILWLLKIIFIGIDDWSYKPYQSNWLGRNEWTPYIVAGILIVFTAIWLVWSIAWIIKGKPQAKNNKIIHDPRRRLGWLGLLLPFSLWLLSAAGGFVYAISYYSSPLYGAILGFGGAIILALLIGYVALSHNTIKKYNFKKGKRYVITTLLIPFLFIGSVAAFIIPTLGFGIGGTGVRPGGIGVGGFSSESILLDGSSSAEIGFSVGGAGDVSNFREHITDGYLPAPSDITHEGIFADYYFETGQEEVCSELFCPSYATAISTDPISGEQEHYLSVGLNSGLTEDDVAREELNLVVVLDISGSMAESFDHNYYSSRGISIPYGGYDDEDTYASKMDLAQKVLSNMTKQLRNNDRLGMIVFDDQTYEAKPLRKVGRTDMKAIRKHIENDLSPQGGTNMEAALLAAQDMFLENEDLFENPQTTENRIIFLTDAQPTAGNTSDERLVQLSSNLAREGIYTTYVGVGVDFNTELTHELARVRGANYFSVHSAKEFKEKIDDDFDLITTPLVFDLGLFMQSEGYSIQKVYGSPQADTSTGELMKVGTLFPSRAVDGEVKGGLVLLKLIPEEGVSDPKITLLTQYEDRSGNKGGDTSTIRFSSGEDDRYETTGIRKGITLSRYVNLMKNWLIEESSLGNNIIPYNYYAVDYYPGFATQWRVWPPQVPIWPSRTQDLRLTAPGYAQALTDFHAYLSKEVGEIGDFDLSQETDIIKKILDSSTEEIEPFDEIFEPYDSTIHNQIINIMHNKLSGTPTTDLTPRIMMWSGKVNQHVDIDSGKWQTDPDGYSGSDINKINYCQKWYPDTVRLEENYKQEDVNTWRASGNSGSYTSRQWSHRCVVE